MSRKIEDLIPRMQAKCRAFTLLMDGEHLPFILTCTKRTPEEQAALYAQGRTTPGKIVTWAQHSRHEDGEAFDIVILKNGKPDWSDLDSYRRAGILGESVGLVWGGRWKTPDYPHFQDS
jgi:peptidoglycan L-alanyl-D-glutamate endopeptidase CwlK